MKKFLLGFAEGYFIVSVIIYIVTYLILKKPINTLFYLETYPILLGLFYVGYKYQTKESKIGNWWTIILEFEMKVVQVLQKAWPEFTICCSSMVYIIVRIVADVNKINLSTWFEYFNILRFHYFWWQLFYFLEVKKNVIKVDKMNLNFVAPVLGQSWGMLEC